MKNFTYGFVYSLNLNRLRRLTAPVPKPVFSAQELAKAGIPAAKIPRLRQELARLAAADPSLSHNDLLTLAKPLARQLPE